VNGAAANPALDPAVQVARDREDVVVGDDIVRHRLATRVVHWSTAFFFFVALGCGLPIYSPVFGWLAHLFGGLAVCRWLHPWTGIAFTAFTAVMFVQWVGDMKLERSERGWFGRKLVQYLRHEGDDPDVGKYNGGQKLLFWAVSAFALALLVTGTVLWFPERFEQALREAAILLHDLVVILFSMAIVFHVYLGTVAEPGTFASMTRGTVSKAWARLHHPRWYREVTGEATRDDSRPR
jgi:formate dehydrogenase subunit gamma